MSLRLLEPRGLGARDTGLNDQIRYLYCIAWESDSGSISPLSGVATASWVFTDEDEPGAYGVLLRGLDQGMAGVIAIRIYRTKSLVNVSEASQAGFYFLDRIRVGSEDYLDIIPDSQLVDAAPALTDSVPIPPTLRYLESWDGKLWAAGGPGNEQRVIYSGVGPEQFPAFNFWDCGMRQGGAITGLQAYLGVLIIFRERAIEVITPSESGAGYRLTVLSPDVGTTATNTTTYVPGVGVFFLGYDGVRLIRGQGTSLELVRNSAKVAKDLSRLSRSALPRATASWSEREREWWCHYPADGSATPNRGIVYHRDLDAWSVRAPVATSSPGAFQFNALATLPSGYFIFGCQTLNTGVGPTAPILWNMGLQVWTAKGMEGVSINGAQLDDGIFGISSTVLGAPVTGQWVSKWECFGNDTTLKSVRSVLVEGVTVGHLGLTLDYAVDWTERYISVGTQTASLSSRYGGVNEASVYAPGLVGDNVALLDSSRWTSEKVTRMRWDVATSAISWFKWRLSATTRFYVLRYKVAYIRKKVGVLKQGAR